MVPQPVLTATASYTVDSWEEVESREHGGAAIGRAELTKTFVGDIVGTSRVELLGVTAADEGSRAYVALEELDVSVDGHAGTFVLVHHGIQGGLADATSWTIAPGSGSGALAGIHGTASLTLEDDVHSIVLEYALGPEA